MSLHPGELAHVRSAFTPQLTATATILRRHQVRDQTGGFTDTYEATGAAPCSYSRYPIRPLVRENAPRVQDIANWLFVFKSGTDIRVTDRLQVGSRSFDVTESGERSNSVTLLVICLEIL